MSDFRLPANTQRTSIIGRTGSGKTVAGSWVLSEAPFDKQPYIIVDYKGDELLNSSDRIKEIDLKTVPKQPGLYIVHPRLDQVEQVDAWLWKVWERENVGLYFDEAYMLPDKGALQAILTQGRSKRIPVIALTQRPALISRFIFSEADFFAVFQVSIDDDKKRIRGFIPSYVTDARLPDYHFRWYDVSKDKLFNVLPVPAPDDIRDRIDSRLSPKRRTT